MKHTLYYIVPLLLVAAGAAVFFKRKDGVVLRVDRVSVTDYEFEKNLRLFKTGFMREKGRAPAESEIQKWVQGFIDRTYFLADACHKGYDTLPDVRGKVWGMEQTVIAGRMGRAYTGGKAGIDIHRPTLDTLNRELQGQGTLHEFDKRLFSDLLPRTIMTYRIAGQVVRVSVGQFMDFYNDLPLRREIDSASQLVPYLETLVYDDYAYRKAEEMGMTKERTFLLDKENFTKNVMYSLYKTQEFKASAPEIEHWYDTHKKEFSRATDVVVSGFSFVRKTDAVSAMMELKRGIVPFLGAEQIDRDWKLNYKSNALSDSIKSVIFGMKINEVSRPMPLNGRFIVIVKASESGSRTASLDEVRDIMAKEVEEVKMQAYLVRLKSTYSCTIKPDR